MTLGAGPEDDDLVVIAPIQGDSRFVEFSVRYKTRSNAASAWSMVRTVVDSVPPNYKKYVVDFPVGAQYQEKAPAFLRNLTILDSRAPGSNRMKQEHGDVYFDLLSPLLQELGVGHVYVATNSSTSITENAASFSSSGTVVILGGDTSLHEFVNALGPGHGQDMRLHIVPTGTGNALANSIGLLTPLIAVRRLILARSHDFVPLSVFRVEIPPHIVTAPPAVYHAIVVASWGFHSAIVADSDSLEMRRRFASDPPQRFREAARLNLEFLLQDYVGDVHGGAEFGPRHSYLLFTPVKQLEAGFTISPDSKPPSDSNLHMIAIPSFASIDDQKTQLMQIMMEVYDDAKHVQDPRVRYVLVEGPLIVDVHDQPENMRRWCIDGIIVVSPPGKVRIDAPTSTCNGWNLRILPASS